MIREIQGGGNKGGRIHPAGRTEQDPVRVDQKHPAVARQAAQDR